jgi:AcrR family transcriptional regulator
MARVHRDIPRSRGARTREALLRAATERFSRDGFRATSIADISRDAGVGPTTAYVHYPNKEALFLAAVDADLSALFEQIVPVIEDADPGADLTGTLFTGLLGAVEEHPLARRLLAGLEPSITERVLATEAFEQLRATIARRMTEAQEAGDLRPDLDPARFADGVISIVVALLMAAIQIGRGVLDVRGPGLAAAFQAMFAPDPRLEH